MISWVVGRGLLGNSLVDALARRSTIWKPAERLSWHDSPALRRQLEAACRQFAAATQGTAPWQVAWCAGAGVVGSRPDDMAAETSALEYFLEALARALPDWDRGVVFLASSAGGVFGGSSGPPFTERSLPRPLGAYGAAKLAQEELARRWATHHGVPLLIGRVANLYGTGQDLSKPQGLITQLAKSVLDRQPIVLYVPLDTIRDYVYAPDCGSLAADAIDRLRNESRQSDGAFIATKILATQRGTTIAMLLAVLRRIVKRAPLVVMAASPLGQYQTRDLRLKSVTWPDLDRRTLTPLPVGMHAVLEDLGARRRGGTASLMTVV